MGDKKHVKKGIPCPFYVGLGPIKSSDFVCVTFYIEYTVRFCRLAYILNLFIAATPLAAAANEPEV